VQQNPIPEVCTDVCQFQHSLRQDGVGPASESLLLNSDPSVVNVVHERQELIFVDLSTVVLVNLFKHNLHFFLSSHLPQFLEDPLQLLSINIPAFVSVRLVERLEVAGTIRIGH